MTTRRTFLAGAAAGVGVLAAGQAAAQTLLRPLPANPAQAAGGRYRPPARLGMGGTQISGNFVAVGDEQAQATLQAAWDAGVRYFDTSPWYGLGLSERRLGAFLHDKPRDSFVLSTKIGRLLKPDQSVAGTKVGNWAEVPPFRHVYDYSAEGARRSIEDSLQRMGLASIDIVFIHDLSPDNGDMKERWTEYLEQAKTGAMPELTRMKNEGLIKAWGLGVNTLEPALAAFEAADPDIILSATQYSLIKHEDALKRLMPVAEKRGASIVVGAPLNAGFLAGKPRYDYAGKIPEGAVEKRRRLSAIAENHGTDLRTMALHFAAAHPAVSAIIPGARDATQAAQNAASMRQTLPPALWEELREAKLIATEAPLPS
ncbi:aldo/keto reductase [Methylopila turkensis]|uniref:L-fucose dehydrogenase n=1 Tax=Methylopila turkensis TaxID=1437816 RepID=A0A9W6JMA6_9HYPH|nr:aldo/keto reductase [Methylopila turkensis]GLK80251.1 L-fucose dehydrogenase [Methylopila turkensis]